MPGLNGRSWNGHHAQQFSWAAAAETQLAEMLAQPVQTDPWFEACTRDWRGAPWRKGWRREKAGHRFRPRSAEFGMGI